MDAQHVQQVAPPPYLPDEFRERNPTVSQLPPKYRPESGVKTAWDNPSSSVNDAENERKASVASTNISVQTCNSSVSTFDSELWMRRRRHPCSRRRLLHGCCWLFSFVVVAPIWLASVVVIWRGLSSTNVAYYSLPAIESARSVDDSWLPVQAEKGALSRRSPVDIPMNSSTHGVSDTGIPAVASSMASDRLTADGAPNPASSKTSESLSARSGEPQVMLVKASSGGQKYNRLLKVFPRSVNEKPDKHRFNGGTTSIADT